MVIAIINRIEYHGLKVNRFDEYTLLVDTSVFQTDTNSTTEVLSINQDYSIDITDNTGAEGSYDNVLHYLGY